MITIEGTKIFLNVSQQPEITLCYLTPLNTITFTAQAISLGKGDMHEQAWVSLQQHQRGTAWGRSGLATSLHGCGKGYKQEQGQLGHWPPCRSKEVSASTQLFPKQHF